MDKRRKSREERRKSTSKSNQGGKGIALAAIRVVQKRRHVKGKNGLFSGVW
jgi:hypothetical protein